MFSKCKNVFEVLYHHAEFGEPVISLAVRSAKNTEFSLCVCVSVTLVTDELVNDKFAMVTNHFLGQETIFD